VRLRDGLLVLLLPGRRHGYQLKLDFERLTGSAPVNVGQVYSTLDRLARDRLVARCEDAACERGRIEYALTREGESAAWQWLLDPGTIECKSRSSVAAKVLLAHHVPGLDRYALLDSHRAALVAAARAARQQHRATGDDLVTRLLGDAEAAVIEAELRWLDLYEDAINGEGEA
jgi:DNA-binding PadR family transcriptional regulator